MGNGARVCRDGARAGDGGVVSGLLRADTITPKQLPMLWRDRIPANTLSVIAGDPGLGKSTLAAMIAAELSRAGLHGIISNVEDDPEAVTRPRLEVAQAKLENISLVPHDYGIAFPGDLPALSEWIEETSASYVMLDPVAAHFRPATRVHDRTRLVELLTIARKQQCAIIGFHHTIQSVSPTGDPLHRIGGPSSGLAGSARAAFLYGYDPEDEDQRALVCVKINGVELPPALVLDHETIEYDSIDGIAIEAGRMRVHGESNIDGARTLRRGKRKAGRDAEATAWLTEFLAGGDDATRMTAEIRDVAKEAGFAWQTVLRARVAIKAERFRKGFGGEGYWLWRLPEAHPYRKGDAVAQEAELT